jgi:hypothetical protein
MAVLYLNNNSIGGDEVGSMSADDDFPALDRHLVLPTAVPVGVRVRPWITVVGEMCPVPSDDWSAFGMYRSGADRTGGSGGSRVGGDASTILLGVDHRPAPQLSL